MIQGRDSGVKGTRRNARVRSTMSAARSLRHALAERLGGGAKNALAALGGLALAVVALALCEGTLRLWEREFLARQRGLLVYSARLGWEIRRDARVVEDGKWYTIDPQGIRAPPKPARHDKRVVLLGDSVVFGHEAGDEETFAHIVSARANGLSCLNLAVPGYGPCQEYLQLVHEVTELRADAVVLGLCRANDFADTVLPVFLYDGVTPKPSCSRSGDQLIVHPARSSVSQRLLAQLFDQSHLVNRLVSGRPPGEEDANERTPWRARYSEAIADGEAQQTTFVAIRAMHDHCRLAGQLFLVLVFPSSDSFARASGRRLEGFRAVDVLRPVEIVDMAERFQARGLGFHEVATDPIGHLTSYGHRVTAEVLEQELSQRGLGHKPATENEREDDGQRQDPGRSRGPAEAASVLLRIGLKE